MPIEVYHRHGRASRQILRALVIQSRVATTKVGRTTGDKSTEITLSQRGRPSKGGNHVPYGK